MIKDKIKSFWMKFENLLFENHSCLACGDEIQDGMKFSLCKDCFEKIEKVKNDISNIYDGKTLNIKNKNKIGFDQNISYCYYNEVASTIVKLFKYSGKRYYAKYIAQMISEDNLFLGQFDYITFVPSSLKAKKKKGYNQSEDIAIELSKIINIPVYEILGKNEGYVNQASLSMVDRLNNLKNAFFVIDSKKQLIHNKNILLIDDVFTTGTTLTKCSNEIKKFKPNILVTMTFAKTKFLDDE